jgi:hypothetical protein
MSVSLSSINGVQVLKAVHDACRHEGRTIGNGDAQPSAGEKKKSVRSSHRIRKEAANNQIGLHRNGTRPPCHLLSAGSVGGATRTYPIDVVQPSLVN